MAEEKAPASSKDKGFLSMAFKAVKGTYDFLMHKVMPIGMAVLALAAFPSADVAPTIGGWLGAFGQSLWDMSAGAILTGLEGATANLGELFNNTMKGNFYDGIPEMSHGGHDMASVPKYIAPEAESFLE